nr:hypothetical protein [Geodermatophilus pulveris]
MATTWSLSIEAADRMNPVGLSSPLLNLAAQLDSNGIPTAVFITDPVRAHLTEAASEPGSSTADSPLDQVLAEDVEDALRNLHRLSLITLTPDQDGGGSGSVGVHALVQRATREQAAPAVTETAARVAADALLQAWPQQDYQPEQALLAQSLRNNTDALAATAPGPLWTPDAHLVLFRAGRSRTDGGLLALAVPYWAILSSTAEQRLGPDHPSTLGRPGQPRTCLSGRRAAGRGAAAVRAHPCRRRAAAGPRPH